MPRQRIKAPRYLFHKQSGRGRLVWTDALGTRHEQLIPGPFQSVESIIAKNRLETEILASPTRALMA